MKLNRSDAFVVKISLSSPSVTVEKIDEIDSSNRPASPVLGLEDSVLMPVSESA